MPNIVFFFTDDQRFDTIHALGNTHISTPNIDSLVANGTTFTHAHIPCGTCGAVCMPSRAMLHTGRPLFHIQDMGQEIPSEHITLGETLRNAGYNCFGTGKWHNGTDAYARSFTHGDHIFFGGMWDHWNVPAASFDPTGKYENVITCIHDPFHSNKTTHLHADHICPGNHSTELFSDAAVSFVEGYDDDAPFFMYLSFMAPHDPRSMPEEFLSMYSPDELPLPNNYLPEHPIDYGIRDMRDEVLAPYPRSPEIVRKHLAEYYAMISHLDHHIGRVINALKDKGIYDDTIFVFAGDNGLALGQHGLFGKQNAYEHSIRVPLIFAGPGIPKGQQNSAYTYLYDIYPTLCDMLDIDLPASVEGISQLPVIHGETDTCRKTLYAAYADRVRAVKNKRFKLIEYAWEDTRATQLFDLIDDPDEMNNLADDDSYADILSELRNQMYTTRDEWDDQKHPIGATFWNNYT